MSVRYLEVNFANGLLATLLAKDLSFRCNIIKRPKQVELGVETRKVELHQPVRLGTKLKQTLVQDYEIVILMVSRYPRWLRMINIRFLNYEFELKLKIQSKSIEEERKYLTDEIQVMYNEIECERTWTISLSDKVPTPGSILIHGLCMMSLDQINALPSQNPLLGRCVFLVIHSLIEANRDLDIFKIILKDSRVNLWLIKMKFSDMLLELETFKLWRCCFKMKELILGEMSNNAFLYYSKHNGGSSLLDVLDGEEVLNVC
ncbi:hypothetical protein BC833DRAFT_659262 [Globomyces pollinis-pini]|nr:hypothetical protein BC833DRAFT_659262 [Globomyces pollinis-pini]